MSIALDDFGTGFDPVDVIKIDQSFVRDMCDDPRQAAISSAIIGLGGTLGMDVIAEGIETAGQADLLLSQGCRHGHGFLFGEAVCPEEAETLLLAEEYRAERSTRTGARSSALPSGIFELRDRTQHPELNSSGSNKDARSCASTRRGLVHNRRGKVL